MDRIQLASLQEQWLSAHIDGSNTNFDKHQENGRELIFTGATDLQLIFSAIIVFHGKSCIKTSKGSQNRIVFRTDVNNWRQAMEWKKSCRTFDCQGVVHCVPCSDCDQKYFGETRRSLNTRKNTLSTVYKTISS